MWSVAGALLLLHAPVALSAQDTLRTRTDSARTLRKVEVRERPAPPAVRAARPVEQGLVTTGARSEVVSLDAVNTALAEKTGRHVFARVPGVQVYDMDGAGNQLNVSTRGLDPHRAWELNVRQDGVLLNSDTYGYPASHYTPPLEAIESLTLVRGTAALQYGAQQGGVLNYVTRGPDTTRAIAYRGSHTLGSFAQRATFHSMGGRAGAFDWLAYGAARTSNGYRDNEQTRSLAGLLRLDWRATPTLLVRAQSGYSGYRYRIPGPLTDAQFRDDPTQATRARNFYSPSIIVPSLAFEWRPHATTEVRAQMSGLYGDRSSVQFIGFATVPDTVLASGARANRQVDIDNFRSQTFDARLLHGFVAGGREHRLAVGVTAMVNRMRRRQQGVGTTGSDWNLQLARGDFARNITYATGNVALFAEQSLALSSRWTVVPGARMELGETRLRGRLAYFDSLALQRDLTHRFPLLGVRSEYRASSAWTWYGGASQSYRPLLLKDALPDSPLERVDAGIRDARGWNLEAGVRGEHGISGASLDVGVFRITTDARFGLVARTDAAGSTLLYKTSLGATATNGVELRADLPLRRRASHRLTYFTGSSYMRGQYRSGTAVDRGVNVPISGNAIEGVPAWIIRQGLDLVAGRWAGTVQSSYTSASLADPLNTRVPTANGARGLVPSHHVVDVNAMWRVSAVMQLSAGLSNVFDEHYFTKRPTIYPGPGVWPSAGRGFRFTVDLTP